MAWINKLSQHRKFWKIFFNVLPTELRLTWTKKWFLSKYPKIQLLEIKVDRTLKNVSVHVFSIVYQLQLKSMNSKQNMNWYIFESSVLNSKKKKKYSKYEITKKTWVKISLMFLFSCFMHPKTNILSANRATLKRKNKFNENLDSGDRKRNRFSILPFLSFY